MADMRSVKELGAKIEEFFAECEETGNPPAVSDLALRLGFDSRLDLLSCSVRPDCMKIIKRALLKIEGFTERKLFDKGCSSGAKYSLANNFKGWSDNPGRPDAETIDKLDIILNELSKTMTKG
jgi:hypothetical protein